MIDGEKFAKLRKQAGLTQPELAQRIGVSTQVLWRAENEMKDLSLSVAAIAAHEMGCKVDDFLKAVRLPS